MEDVHDTVHVVEQRPATLRQPFGHTSRHASGLEPCLYMFSYGSDVRIGCPTSDNKEVGHIRHAAQIEDHDVGGFEIRRKSSGAACDGFAGNGGVFGHRKDERGKRHINRKKAIPSRTLKVAFLHGQVTGGNANAGGATCRAPGEGYQTRVTSPDRTTA